MKLLRRRSIPEAFADVKLLQDESIIFLQLDNYVMDLGPKAIETGKW